MKLKRAKAYRKAMSYMQINFKFREPYQVLVDEEIVIEAARIRYDLVAGLERTLQGEVKVLITQCTMEHLYRSKNTAAIDLAKSFERRKCGHIPKDDQTISAFECIESVVGPTNKHRYIVASQKPKLRAKFRHIPAIPLIHIVKSVMVMEPLSQATLEVRKEIESSKLTQGLNRVSEKTEDHEATAAKKRKRKEPNPLSVKRKDQSREDGPGKKRRKRGKKENASENATHDDPEQHSPEN